VCWLGRVVGRPDARVAANDLTYAAVLRTNAAAVTLTSLAFVARSSRTNTQTERRPGYGRVLWTD
jgi:hypothetical protein